VKLLGRNRKAGIAALAVGAALFGVLVYQTGPRTIADGVRQCGPALALIVPISALRHVLRAVAWRLCIPAQSRHVPFADLLGIRIAAEAVGGLTFAGPLLGESAKAYVVSRRMPATETLSSIVIENLAYSLSLALLLVGSVLVLLVEVSLPDETRAASAFAGLALALPVAAAVVAVRRRWMPVTATIAFLRARGLRVHALVSREEKVREFESQVMDFYSADHKRFFAVLALEAAAFLPGILEGYIILAALTGRGSLLAAFFVETTFRAINALFMFLPLRVGVDEGGTALTLGALGFSPADGVSLAIVRKIRTLVWVAVGLAILGRYSLARTTPAGGDAAALTRGAPGGENNRNDLER
jgi:hypothetical protein